MPAARPALAISAIAHAGALLGLGLAPTRDDIETVAVEAPAVEIVPIEVALAAPAESGTPIGDAPSPAPGATRSIAATHRGPPIAAAATSGSEIGHAAPTEAGHDWMHMRAPGVDLALPATIAEKLAETDARAPAVAVSGRLTPRGGGTAVIKDATATIDVHRDGTIDIRHAPDFEIHFVLPHLSLSKLRQGIGDSIDAWYKDAYAQARVGRIQDLPRHEQAIPGDCDRSESWCGVKDDDGTPSSGDDDDGGLFFIKGRADISSWLSKKTGVGDDYRARKQKLVDITRDERVRRGGAYRTEQLERSAEIMRKNLERLWLATIEPAARRRALFELWDECGEGDSPLGEAGQRARGQVMGWIATHLPAGSRDAFTPDEIAGLDARRSSTQRFAPY